jgi:RimJ/RimL family protein N-acetyltransferase
LTTERIGFRLWQPDDLLLALSLWGDTTVTRLIADLGQPSEEQARARLDRELANQQTYGVQYWPIFRRAGGEHLGCCGLRPYQPDQGIYEIGAHLLAHYWGQGYATEAVRAVVAHAFTALPVRGLFARHHPDNHGSRSLLAKLGFQYTHDDFLPQTGLNHPSYLLWAPGATGAVTPESTQPIVIQAADPTNPEVRRLIDQLDAYQSTLYPALSLRLTPVELLQSPDVTFLVARVGNEIAGCGALVNRGGEYAELKRMYVLPHCRGLGIGRRLLAALESRAWYLSLRRVMLETGIAQPEALRLYEKAGYQRRGPFGGYTEDGLTIFMEKELG